MLRCIRILSDAVGYNRMRSDVFGDLQNCSDEGIQIFGGMGFSADTPMESAWRDARIGRIYEGTNEINRMLSVGMLLKKGMKGQIDLMGSVMKAANAFGQNTSNQIISDNHLSHFFL